MKIWNIVMLGFALTLVGCAATEKAKEHEALYNFPELERVNSIDNFRMDGWEEVDKYTVIVNSIPRESYLLVLSGGLNNLNFTQGLLVTSTLGKVEVGFDTVSTPQDPLLKAQIKRIYRLKDKTEKEAIEQKILTFAKVEDKETDNKSIQ
ncbi:Conserved hypothetical protein [Shewanella piezotolerans WP3]|uniref:Lipoprotein n=1 Tax=Shewanella piezotolerans (strain WP3 / JCM 13877) TaxID=225849 RepID=B8CLT2_SHEPW|nr:DUF6491 family protein [Shewanella piezotolerans]ACJ28856.1 Conserved hypothetical protein [Shewanella piezotolerans WP3]